MNKSTKHEIHNLEISKIETDPNQPRKHFDKKKLKELENSIQQHGIIQPIIVKKDEEGKIILVAGERRLKAAQNAKLKQIPAIFIEGKNTEEISLIENLQRENLTVMEEAEALEHIKNEYNYNLGNLSKILGKAQSTISETLGLIRLPEEIRDECRTDPIWSRRILVEISKKDSEKEMKQLFKKVKKKDLKSNEIRLQTRKGSPHRTKNEMLVDKLSSLETDIKALKFDKDDDNQKNEVKNKLISLRDEINSKIEKL